MSANDGLLCAYRLDGSGGGTELDWESALETDAAASIWVHLHLDSEQTHNWLRNQSGLPDIVVDALLSEETRPRCTAINDGLLVNLRGVNLNPGSEPEDMVSIRLYIDHKRIVSVRRRILLSVQDIREEIAAGHGPKNSADFLAEITDKLMIRIGPVISDLDDAVDAVEDHVIENTRASLRGDLWRLRRQAIALRRHISPQREAIARIASEIISWIDAHAGQRLRETVDRITRYVEELDSARERAAIIQDELATRLSEQINRNMYILSVIASIFLPLSLITGLLGINVAGIPGDKWPLAFTVVTAGLVVVGIIEYFLFRRLKWI